MKFFRNIESVIKSLYIVFLVYFSKRKILLGPYHGEFGYEVVYNQSLAASLFSKWGERVFVITKKNNRGLYPTIPASNFLDFNYSLIKSGYGFGRSSDSKKFIKLIRENFKNHENSIFIDLSVQYIPIIRLFIDFLYKPLGNRNINESKIVFHFRDLIKDGTDERENFDLASADRLVNKFKELNFITVCIGHPNYSYCPSTIDEDQRSENVFEAIDQLSKSYICIGQLSGPIHLANMCKVNVITWADGAWRFNCFPEWNPFDARVDVVTKNSFNPTIDEIFNKFKAIYQ